MNETEYKSFVQDVFSGHIIIGIDRPLARTIYTDRSLSEFQQATGEKPYFEKAIVLFAFIAQYLAIIVTVVSAIPAFGWWAALLVPVAILVWFYNASRSTKGRATIKFHTTALFLLFILEAYLYVPKVYASFDFGPLFRLSFVFALWCSRFVYVSASNFLRAFILRNPRAFEAFSDAIVLQEQNAVGKGKKT